MISCFTKVFKVGQRPLKSFNRQRTASGAYNQFLKNLSITQISVLPSRFTVATEERDCSNVCFGFYINAGARYENDFENGITHFFQHIAFKGTTKRCKTTLEREISKTGAKFKCFTTRDITVFYVQCLAQDTALMADILYDCIFNNSYAEPEIEIQKNVVYQEMLKDDGCTEKVLYDYLHSSAFQGTNLGQTVMGPSSNLYNFKMSTMNNYIRKMFIPQRMVLAAVGGVKHELMVNIGEQYFGKAEGTKCIILGPCRYRYTGSELTYRDDSMHVAHIALGVEGPSFCDDDKLTMNLASAVIGGWDTFQPGGPNHGTAVACKVSASAVCESYKTFNFAYNDTGLWGVEFITPRLDIECMLYFIQDEWMRLCDMITDGELIRPKNELISKILMQNQNTEIACHDIGQHVLRTGRHPSVCDRLNDIENITAKHLKTVCDKYIYDRCPVIIGIGSTECLLPYPNIRNGMYWLRV